MKKTRVRFAPSPTGALHIGGLRTALYNYLLARQTGGTMILRIEDTDQGRFVPGAEAYIAEALQWAGIQIDEGVGPGGPFGPYRQSERRSIYQEHAQQLINQGHAYYAFDSEDDLEAMRQRLKAAGADDQQYGVGTRLQMVNSLTLPPAEVASRLASGTPYVIRFKVPENKSVVVQDLIRGEVVVSSNQVDDKVLMKSDGMPTYHLANVVDDHLMQISHVIRGEEWLPSAPIHVLLYEAFGWTETMPRFAHLPLLLKPDGHGKLSKRDADQLGFPIFPLNWKDPRTGEVATGYREAGYLPEALINFLAFLGWNPGTEQEIFSMQELVKAFAIERIGKAGTRFDIHKAQWFNQHYLRSKSTQELSHWLLADLKNVGTIVSEEIAQQISDVLRDRITFPSDLFKLGRFFIERPLEYDQQVFSKKWNKDAVAVLSAFADSLPSVNPYTAEPIKATFEQTAANLGVKPGQVLQVLRVSVTGQASGPDLMKSMEILGRDETIERIRTCIRSTPLPG
ncbi:MAG: glutamate--tRNA ligase [Cyclobacteriaceae bacterium]